MVNATVENPPVSEALSNGDSVTVPTGEVWRVTCSLFSDNHQNASNSSQLSVNGTLFLGIAGDLRQGPINSPTTDAVFESGDTISFNSDTGNGGALISGFVVNS